MTDFKGFDAVQNQTVKLLKQRRNKMYSKDYIRSCLRRLAKEGQTKTPLQERQELTSIAES